MNISPIYRFLKFYLYFRATSMHLIKDYKSSSKMINYFTNNNKNPIFNDVNDNCICLDDERLSGVGKFVSFTNSLGNYGNFKNNH